MRLPLGMDLEVLPSQYVNRYTTLPVSYVFISWLSTYRAKPLIWLVSWLVELLLCKIPNN